MDNIEIELSEEEVKQEYIRKYFEDDKLLETASADELETYKKYIKEGIKKNWIIALYALAYGCYGGNAIFKCDWNKSRDTLLKIIDIQGDEDPFVYNTLGYIYYYGRCNNGQPEYDLAFKYFSVGAANGVFESMYKTADMYMTGKGVPKSEKAGAKIILDMYEENRDIFSDEHYDCKFADVALRVGGLFEKGIGLEQDYEGAYFHYCEARYALELRMKERNYYGDSKVMKNIEDAICRVKDMLPDEFFQKSFVSERPNLIGMMLSNSVAIEIELRKEGKDFYLVADRYAAEDMPKSFLLNIPEIGYCELINKLKIKIGGAIVVDEFELPKKAFVDSIREYEDENTWVFSFRDVELLEITCDSFEFCG